MKTALRLARCGRGLVEPNPMVGAVLARGGVVVGRGWHRRFGGPHAEIEALDAARRAGIETRGATMYVTLEPCCHHGKTPPCTEDLIAAGIRRVVAAIQDPDRQVAGRGLARLRQAGVAVTTGICEPAARRLLGPYIKLRTEKRPWVICKWAQATDGCVALTPAPGRGKRRQRPVPEAQRWISDQASRAAVHRLRGRCDGILVGVGTVLADDPMLTNRSGRGRQPTRVVLDSTLRTPSGCQLVVTAAESPVLIATKAAGSQRGRWRKAAEALGRAGVEVLALPGGEGGVDLGALLDELGRRNWTHLLVEGGPTILGRFVASGLADELLAFICPTRPALGRGEAADLPRFDIADLRRQLDLGRAQRRAFGPDTLLRYVLRG